MLCERRRVAKQFQIETWLDLAQVVKELGIGNTAKNGPATNRTSYII
jgi:hypothetical protein